MKDWLMEVGVKTFGPSAIRGAILGVSGWLLMKNNALAPFGIVSDAAQHLTTIYWDKLSVAAITALPAIIAGAVKMVQHQGTQVIQSAVTPPKGDNQ